MAESSDPEPTYALQRRSTKWNGLVNIWSIEACKLGFLTRLVRPVRPLACPARFERATYALEALKMRLNNTRSNDIEVLKSGVQ
jgi:hypothetical protein